MTYSEVSRGLEKKELDEQLEIERRIAQDSIAILDRELAAKKISKDKYKTEVNKINMGLAQTEAELMIQNAADELAEWERVNQSKLESGKVWSDESVALEKQRLEEHKQMQLAHELDKYTRGLTTER